jgi:hypothetical protein
MAMDQNQVAFLLEMLIGKFVNRQAIADSTDFILSYRLDETTAENVMNEVSSIANEVNAGSDVTSIDALHRIGRFARPVVSPTTFVHDAFKAWAPDIWSRLT